MSPHSHQNYINSQKIFTFLLLMGLGARIQRLRQQEHASLLRRTAIALAKYKIEHIRRKTRRLESLHNLRRLLAGKRIVNFINTHYKK